MRTIKFRGKRKNWNPEYGQSEWMLGNLLNDKSIGEVGYGMDSYVYAEVIPETIGQFTGLTDKNGKEIFEGDILLSKSWGANSRSKRKTHIVKWGKVEWIASGYNGEFVVNPSLDVKSDWEVVGNIHDNVDLLK